MSLHESEDARIVRIVKEKSNDKKVVAEIAARIDQDQRGLFLYNPELLKFDARSSLARFGFNVVPIEDFVWEDNSLVMQVEIYNFIPVYFPWTTPLAQFFEEGVPIGKYYFDDPSRHVSTSTLSHLLESRQVITGESSQVLENGDSGILRLPLQKIIFTPTDIYSERELRNIIHKRVPRGRLTKYQNAHRVEDLIVPADSGIVTIATLMTSGLEVIVNGQLSSGVRHAEAKMGSQHTKFDFFVEYIGNHEGNVEIDSIDVILAQPRAREFKIYVPASLSMDPDTKLEDNPHLKGYINRFKLQGDNLRFMEYFVFSDNMSGLYRRLSRDDLEAQANFYHDLQGNRNVTLTFNQFPGKVGTDISGDISDYLIRLAKQGILKTVHLNNASNGLFFSQSALEDLNSLWENDATIYWRNPTIERWMIYDSGFWVKPEKLQEFIDYRKSGKLVAFYGSSDKMSGELEHITEGTLDSISSFYGGNFGFITGGWGKEGSFMEVASKKAREKGALVGAVFWNIPGQSNFADVDFVQYYDEVHLNTRQELIARVVEAEFYGKGGVGTGLERYNTLTNMKIGIGARKPMFLLGEAGQYRTELQEQVSGGLTPSELLKNVYVVKDGKEVYSMLCNHFKTAM